MRTKEIIRQLKIAQARFMMVEKQRPAIFKAIKIIKDNEWISVDDYQPEDDFEVLVASDDDVKVSRLIRCGDDSYYFERVPNVTHWKPLPEPPK